MLLSVRSLAGFSVLADGGPAGRVREVYLDHQRWCLRHFVVEHGGLLSRQRVLLPADAVVEVDAVQRRLRVALPRDVVLGAPAADADCPLSESYGAADLPRDDHAAVTAAPKCADPALCSSREVCGYGVVARDGAAAGRLHDFLVDPFGWQVTQVLVDTQPWLLERLVMVPPRWVRRIDWCAQQARLGAARREIEQAPRYAASDTAPWAPAGTLPASSPGSAGSPAA